MGVWGTEPHFNARLFHLEMRHLHRLPQLNDCSVQGKSEGPHPCLCVLFVKGHEQSFPDEEFARLLGKHNLLG